MRKIAITVPSTMDIDKPVDNAEMVEAVENEIALFFGGFTTYQAFGGYIADSGKLVREPVTIVTSFVSTLKQNQRKGLFILAHRIAKQMNQESVLLEIGAKVYFVTQDYQV
jgi:hypothetical protein